MPAEKQYDRSPDFCLTELGRRVADENRGLCGTVAKAFLGRGLGFQDLLSAGYEGLCHAAAKFDPTRGYRFSTYAVPWIRRSILVELWEHRLVQLPRYRPREKDLAEHYERHRTRRTVPIKEGLTGRVDPPDSSEDILALRDAIARLPEPYREIVERRLAGDTLKDIAASRDVSRQAIQRMEMRTRAMIRRTCTRISVEKPASWTSASH